MSSRALIEQAERARCDALVRGDIAALDQLLHDDLIHIHANGATEDKAGFLATAANRFQFLKMERRSFDVLELHSQDIAMSVGVLHQDIRIIQRDEIRSMQIVTTQIWARRDGMWKQRAFQATSIL